jgi:alanyl-tRNA synthetase
MPDSTVCGDKPNHFRLPAVPYNRCFLREVLLEKSTEVNGVKVIQLQGDYAPDMVRSLVSYFRGKFANERFLFVAGTLHDGKPSLTIFLSQQLVDAGMNAVNMVREAAKNIQGGGGGQPFMAQAGGKNPDGIHAAVQAVVAMVQAL